MYNESEVNAMEALRSRKGFICDMDGAIRRGSRLPNGLGGNLI